MNFSKSPLKRNSKNRKKIAGSPSKLSLGLALIATGVIFIFGRNNVNKVYSKSFAAEPVRLEGLSESEITDDNIPKRVIIPSLSLDLEIQKSGIVNGYWEVSYKSANWGAGSGIPGESGNQVVFAHAREGLFLPLRSIKVGNHVYILTDLKWFRYEVKEIKEVYPNQVEVIAPTQDETLTLYTCSGFADTKRLIIIAKPF